MKSIPGAGMAAISDIIDICEENRAEGEVRTGSGFHRTGEGDNPSVAHLVERDGILFAGTHLIVDLWGASNLDEIDTVDAALRDAADAAGATLLNIDLHSFTPNGGITGVAVLAESHISIHTWPERAYAAIDVFMCGEAEPHRAVQILRRAFDPDTLTLSEHRRGVMP